MKGLTKSICPLIAERRGERALNRGIDQERKSVGLGGLFTSAIEPVNETDVECPRSSSPRYDEQAGSLRTSQIK